MANKITTSSVIGAKHQYARKLHPGQIVRSAMTDSFWMVTASHGFVDLSTGFVDNNSAALPDPGGYIVGDVLPFGSGLTLVVE